MESMPAGIVRPSIFAVLRLMTSSNLVDCITGVYHGDAMCFRQPYDHVTLNNNERVCGCDQSTTRILTEVDDSRLDLCGTANRCRHHFDRVRSDSCSNERRKHHNMALYPD
jgi:hypothetical protein